MKKKQNQQVLAKTTEKKDKKDFKVLIVMPKFVFTNKPNYNYMIPLGLTYISAAIKQGGYDVTCLNLNHKEGIIVDVMKRELDKQKFDVVCTSLIGGPNYLMVEKILEATKNHSTKPQTIIGGSLITSEPELIYNALGVDYGVRGEGEITIVELLEAIRNKKDLKKVKGIVYKDNNGKVVLTEARGAIQNIDTIPYPDFEGFEFEEYLKHLYTNQQIYNHLYDYPVPYPILSSRSCPFHCTFCYHSIGYQYRERAINEVIKEIKEAIKKYKVNIVAIYDDMFSYKKERIYEFCRKIKELNKEVSWKIKWSCQLSVANLDEDLLKTMKDAGCEFISYGFESFSQKVLDSMRKPITPKQIDFAIKTTLKHKIGIQGNFIFGDVAETKETARETLKYWKDNCQDQVSLGFVQPLAGSAIYYHCIKKGIIKDRLKFIRSHIEGKRVFNMTDKMTNKEMMGLYEEIRYLRNKYSLGVAPLSVRKLAKDRYAVKVRCPFCKTKIEYKNYYLQKRWLYLTHLICRECHKRFFVSSPFVIFVKMLPVSLYTLLERAYIKMRNAMNIRKISED